MYDKARDILLITVLGVGVYMTWLKWKECKKCPKKEA